MKKKLESAGLAIIYDNRVLLAHVTSRHQWNFSYGIPKGGIEKGESKMDAAIRETKEEVGVAIPRELIDETEHTFMVGNSKIVYYYVVKISSLSQIGLKDLSIPVGQLQLEEVDLAEFSTHSEARRTIMKSQEVLVSNLHNLGLI